MHENFSQKKHDIIKNENKKNSIQYLVISCVLTTLVFVQSILCSSWIFSIVCLGSQFVSAIKLRNFFADQLTYKEAKIALAFSCLLSLSAVMQYVFVNGTYAIMAPMFMYFVFVCGVGLFYTDELRRVEFNYSPFKNYEQQTLCATLSF